nr:hypothetical protein [Tanacetum cinerariifolium]
MACTRIHKRDLKNAKDSSQPFNSWPYLELQSETLNSFGRLLLPVELFGIAKVDKVGEGKGFSGVETPLFEGMLVEQVIEEGGDAEEHVQDVTDGDAAQRDDTTAYGEVSTVSQEPSIPSPTPPTPPLKPPQDLPSTSQVKKPRKGQNRIKTGQKQEAWQSQEKFKAVTVDKGRKTEQNAKRRAKNAYTVKSYSSLKERKKEKG